MKKSKGKMGSHSRKLKKRGRRSITSYLQEFSSGDIVHITINSSKSSIPDPKFQGRTGIVMGRRGRNYVIDIKDGGKYKRLVVSPVHLKPGVNIPRA